MKKFRNYTPTEKVIAIVLAVVVASGVLFGSWKILSTFIGKAAIENVGFALSPSTGTFAPGEEFKVDLKVNSGTVDVNVAAAYLKFNPSELELRAIKRYTANQDVPKPSFESDLGSTPGVAAANKTGELAVVGLTGDQYHDAHGWFKGEGTLATLTFEGKKAGAVSEVTFDKAKSSLVSVKSNKNIIESLTGGRYTIGQAGNQPSITLDPTTGSYKTNQDFNVKVKINSLTTEINVAACYLKFDPSQIKVKSSIRHTANYNRPDAIFESDLGSSTDLNKVNQDGELVIVGLTGDAYHNQHGWFKGEGVLADLTFEGLKKDVTAKVEIIQNKSTLASVSGNKNILGYVKGGEYKFNKTGVEEVFQVNIKSPQNGANFFKGDKITFEVEVINPTTIGVNENYTYKWTSDRDGELSTAVKFDKDDLSVNTHKITVEVTDAAGKKATDSVTIAVKEKSAPVTETSSQGEEMEETGGVKVFGTKLPTSGIIIGTIVLLALIITVVLWALSRRKVSAR